MGRTYVEVPSSDEMLDIFPTIDHSLAEYDAVMAQTVWKNGCLLFMGTRSTSGYGTTPSGKKGQRTSSRAHQIVWKHHNGPIPEGHVLRHKCDTPPCININHLETGTPQDNTNDMMERGRHYLGRGRSRNVPWVNHITRNESGEWIDA